MEANISKSRFVSRFGGIYENSPWVAEQAWDQGLDGSNVLALIDTMRWIVDQSGEDRKLTLLRAHPDLAGKLAVSGELTPASASEQAGAGLDQCSPEEFAAFQDLNETYKDRFRFPFILAVKGHDRTSILASFRKRIGNAADIEFQTAIEQVHRIARFRLETLATEQK